jgi:hypothetical protein
VQNAQLLIQTLVSGLANQKQSLSDLISEHDLLKDELKQFEDTYSKDYKIVNDRIDDINVQIDRTIKDAIKNIPESITTDEIQSLINNSIVEPDLKPIVNELRTYIKENIPEPLKPKDGEDGKDGKDATQQQIDNSVSSWLIENLDLIKGDKGDKGERGLQGQAGQNGSDGVGITDIYKDKEELVITLSDETENRIKLPKQQMQGGGGGTSLKNATSVQIISTSKDIALAEQSQTILIDASTQDINITLPNPNNCFFNNRSYKIGFTRTDLSLNNVNILPFKDETILHEVTQDLFPKEVINLITDGNNWYYFA